MIIGFHQNKKILPAKDTLKRTKRLGENITCLIKDLNLEQTQNSQNSIVRKQTINKSNNPTPRYENIFIHKPVHVYSSSIHK